MLRNYKYKFGSCLFIGTEYNMHKMHHILTVKPLELLRQHILDVVDKVTHCFA